jgi:hypothetical protein
MENEQRGHLKVTGIGEFMERLIDRRKKGGRFNE